MNMIWLCIIPAFSITLVICDKSIDTSHIRVFPAANKSIAGVLQATSLNHLNQPQYAFNASEARRLCLSLGVKIASKAQVKEALSRGLETCRFGWVDEHFAVIPRRKAVSYCGQNQTGLVTWRASVKHKFDVFCFNESDAATQLKDTTTDSPSSSRDSSRQTQSHSEAANTTRSLHSTSTSSSSHLPSSSSTPETMENEAEPARFTGSAQASSGGKAILITSACALLLIAIIVIAYIKIRRNRILTADMKPQEEFIQTEEWTCVKTISETKTDTQEDERIEVDDSES
ncbi:lymphatic vessel endothelial hyaluronic acid receptor 1a [Acanthopagrus latus]|uniref:lymphatic vessel endothelial hyaluronic acid receptor 1a n=1 Tax=Acanthopagrus latus TaxID=8177 RepID=UPI00187BC805|nr:lymphatic vessel endothelial hyaluronic acid receptor 1a [Acanthopagrus latus]